MVITLLWSFFIVNFFNFMAEELREIMAELGIRTVNELVGRADLLEFDRQRADERAGTIDLTPLLENPWATTGEPQHKTKLQPNRLVPSQSAEVEFVAPAGKSIKRN